MLILAVLLSAVGVGWVLVTRGTGQCGPFSTRQRMSDVISERVDGLSARERVFEFITSVCSWSACARIPDRSYVGKLWSTIYCPAVFYCLYPALLCSGKAPGCC